MCLTPDSRLQVGYHLCFDDYVSKHFYVTVTGNENRPPAVSVHNDTELVIGQTNLFLCEVNFTEGRVQSIVNGQWYVNNVRVEKIHEEPFCSLHEVRQMC